MLKNMYMYIAQRHIAHVKGNFIGVENVQAQFNMYTFIILGHLVSLSVKYLPK